MTDTAASVERSAAAALDHLALPGIGLEHGALGVAVSGGSDSLALLHLAARWGRRRQRRVMAVTVDHGLRGAAVAEAAAVARQAHALDLDHATLRAEPAPGNLQAGARAARLAALARWAQASGVSHIALGHTKDDQAETLLLRLARGGAGAEGLAAMRPQRVHHEGDGPGAARVVLLRPLLDLTRADLRAWLTAQGLGWIEEPSNADPAFERVRARALLEGLDPLGLTTDRLADTATRLAGEAAVLQAVAAGAAREGMMIGMAGEVLLDLEQLTDAQDETVMRLLAWAQRALSGGAYAPRREVLERGLAYLRRAATALVGTPRPAEETLTGGVMLACVPMLAVMRRQGAPAPGPHARAVALYREPHAAAPILPVACGAHWDQRYAIGPSGAPTEASFGGVGQALSEATALVEAQNDPAIARRWSAAPRGARITAPALFSPGGDLLALYSFPHGWRTAPGVDHETLPLVTDLVAERLRRWQQGA
ncbi:MAG: tRNA lysidine(34) synthetase TilS [Pseudomonadota bacterium]